MKLDANAHGSKIIADTIEFTMPTFTAIRQLKYLKNGELKSLGTPGAEKTEDAAARALLYPPPNPGR